MEDFNTILGTPISDSKRRWEESGISCLAKCLFYQNPDIIGDAKGLNEKFMPLLENSPPGTTAKEKQAAFAIIGNLLRPDFGPYCRLPQTSSLWLAFRRLFLEIVADLDSLEITEPDGFSCYQFQSDSNSDSSNNEHFDTLYGLSPEMISQIGNPFIEWQNVFKLALESLTEICQERFNAYSTLNLQSVKTYLVEREETFLGPECGFLNEVAANFSRAWGLTSMRIDGLNSQNEETTERILRKIINADQAGSMNFDEELAEAHRSVREVLFDLAVEETLGRIDPGEDDVRELEGKFRLRRLTENPYSILDDDRIAVFVADELAMNNIKFINSLLAQSKKAKKIKKCEEGEIIHSDRWRFKIKRTLALLWIDPNLPLWLMEASIIVKILQLHLPDDSSEITEDLIREHWKSRTNRRDSSLKPSSKKLIVAQGRSSRSKSKNKHQSNEILEIDFPNYIKRSRFFAELRSHCDSLLDHHD